MCVAICATTGKLCGLSRENRHLRETAKRFYEARTSKFAFFAGEEVY